MVKITLTSNHRSLIEKILFFSLHLFDDPASESSSSSRTPNPSSFNISKFVWILLDKNSDIYQYFSNQEFKETAYILDPRDQFYDIPFEDSLIHLTTELMDATRLYPSSPNGKDKFEPLYHLCLESPDGDVVDRFIRKAVEYYQKKLNNIEQKEGQRFVYHYNDDTECWDKFNEIPSRSLSTIYLPKNQVEEVHTDLEKFLKPETKALYEKFGIPYHKTYCFFGPPGSGKTSLINALASSVKKNICVLRLHPKLKDNDLSSSLCMWFPKNSILVLDDIDCIFTSSRDTTYEGITFSGLLNMLDGFSSAEGLAVFMTTNHFVQLDNALKRPGRIDYIREFNYMNREQIYKMMEVFYPQEREDFEFIYNKLKDQKMTIAHLQKFLFMHYPDGKIKDHVDSFLKEYMEFYKSKNNGDNLYC